VPAAVSRQAFRAASTKSVRETEKDRLATGATKHMLWTVVVVLLILWLLGFTMSVGGGLIHLLLVVALICVVINLLEGRRAL
jgi:hypothetical protein